MGGIENGVGYSASKAGIIGLTRAFATRLAKDNINVNCVAPGTTESEIIKQIPPENIERLKSQIPLHRLGTPDKIAAAVAFLASDEADFITGAVLDVNGGIYMG